MATWKGYKGSSVGMARVMGELPFSDGKTADLIQNFTVSEIGIMSTKHRIMPLIPNEWNSNAQPAAFGTAFTIGGDSRTAVLAMCHAVFGNNRPELLFLTLSGVFRYTPWNRYTAAVKGITEQYYYDDQNTLSSVQPSGKSILPPQIVQFGNRMYFTYADDGQAWVWDATRVRKFGYNSLPRPPAAEGPARDGINANNGGFSVRGRVGSTDNDRMGFDGTNIVTVGGILEGLWKYAVVYENSDGSYSETSPDGGTVTIDSEEAPSEGIKQTLRRFRVKDIDTGPVGTVARILLRTFNLRNLPSGSNGEYHFLHRIPNNSAMEYIDDIPDGELGGVWENRMSTPVGVYMMRSYAGSMWLIRTNEFPARVWWSEQTNLFGPVAESIIEGHYLDVFPTTGPITATITSYLEFSDTPVMVIFKANATHYLGGAYPMWAPGTLHKSAGCAGPNLVQVAPDNTVIWYGANTFWTMLTTGQIIDIGAPIRKRLQNINNIMCQHGHSWVDYESKELVFILPYKDSNVPNVQFVWDYLNKGWRIKDGFTVTGGATYVPSINTILIAGVLDFKASSDNGVFALNRGYPGYTTPLRTSIYRSGWNSFGGNGPNLHGSYHTTQSLFTMQETSDGAAFVSVYQDWDFDNIVGSQNTLTAYNPESNTTTAFYGSALYDTAKYRTERLYGDKLSVDLASQTVQSISLTTTEPFQLFNIDLFGPLVSRPGGRTPTGDP